DATDGDTRGGYLAFGFPKEMTNVLHMDVPGGSAFDGASADVLKRANATGIPHAMSFNGFEVIAKPGDSIETVRAPFNAHLEKGRVRAEARRAEAAKIRAEKVASFTKPLLRQPPPGMKLSGVKSGDVLQITPEQLKQLPEGTVL